MEEIKGIPHFHADKYGYMLVTKENGEIIPHEEWRDVDEGIFTKEWKIHSNGANIFEIEYSGSPECSTMLFRGRIDTAADLLILLEKFPEWDCVKNYNIH
jgi:hypothetical protein